MNTIFDETIDILSQALRSIDTDVFERLVDECVDTLKTGNRIVLSGLGKNVPICEKFIGNMVSLGLGASFMHTNSAIHGDLGLVHNGDLVIILSKSGETTESVCLADHLIERCSNTWLLTCRHESTLTRKLKKCLVANLTKEGDPWNIMPINSSTLDMIILNELAMHIAKKLNIKLSDFKRNHPGGAIGQQLADR